ncbi:hypothetical protein [Desulforhabdus sp. TSK]|uniref:hypothetical protein n=1 Tax=Desulforhabdus sp. TSK TaxID=2925014 RepID=UPI001FC84C32|nr:hypothetical protein [Desulforhabdus sp. TSK]GKT08983.1 type IV pilus minor pilin PilX [Desulforhabdus sp. TSK]
MRYKILNDERGIALITTLLMVVIGFAVVVILLLLVTQGVKVTGIEQRYAGSLEAAKGGTDLIINTIKNAALSDPTDPLVLPTFVENLNLESGEPCIKEKLAKATSASPKVNWPHCSDYAATSDPTQNPDLIFDLSSHHLHIKIIDTRDTTSAYIYTIKIRAEEADAMGHAEISVLYQQER